ncbi:pectinacetylesterase family protein [Aquabacterium sp. A7-Y]|uniref:pectin acetylesterase-family hydrolase n=1 Tax=Aquabacterium sp. A7-Y TaxID=1349605 RepID=UPI00223D4A2C|nr:pectin acetylesterase-family hydrolase [Aquabacterium sp. A7-Y]MCW7540385.1 pectinacetylesterase family protein [Aquabacterium sp. A7-Y]
MKLRPRSRRARRAARWLAALGLPLLAPWASAGYFQWDTVELPAASGASCGNGTPYRFFVNRTPFTSKTVIVFEGGGACWDQASCLGEGPLSATNPDGVPADYLQRLNTAAFGLVTPFTARLHPFDRISTQDWNIVYLPYCTGDVHTGHAVQVYSDRDPAQPRVQYHRGQANATGAARWLREHIGRPAELLVTGFSAGGAGGTGTYPVLRDTLQPQRSSLLADSGPLFPAPRNATPEQAPSLPLHNRIREAWGLDRPGALLSLYAGRPGLDPDNLGSVTSALALSYPEDRFSYGLFQKDGVYSAFSYAKFYPDIQNAPDEATRRTLINQRWRQDISQWLPQLDTHANVGYHIPFWRALADAHCLTIVDFSGTGIEERGIADVKPVVENTLVRDTPPMRHVETDQVSDYSRPVNPIQALVTFLQWLFG